MKRNSTKLLTAAILMATGQQAFAAATGTLAGQVITNTASVQNTVNSVVQTAVVNDPHAAFTVDRKVNLTVVASEAVTPLDVTPKDTGQMLTYTVTNLTNDTMDFSLGALDAATGDDFDVTSITSVRVESGATPGYQPLEDTATSIDNLASGDAKVVYVFSTIPDVNGTTIVDGKKAGIVLTATALLSDGSPLANTDDAASADADDTTVNTFPTPDTPGTIQNVYADDDELGSNAGLHNRKDADTGYYKIVTTAISVNKQSFVMWDPINQYTNPKAIPGAILVYCITVTNPSTTVPATSINISDVIDTQLTYNPGSIAVKTFNQGESPATPACNATDLLDVAGDATPATGDAAYVPFTGGELKTDAAPDADGGSYSGAGTHTMSADTPTLQTDGSGAGHSNVAVAVFRATIN
jgi:uncharacterized repeat protein (TIGR01451 family)